MDSSELTTYNKIILKYSHKYLIFHGGKTKFRYFLSKYNQRKYSQDITQFIIMYNQDKKIIFAKSYSIEIVKNFGCNIFKSIAYFCKKIIRNVFYLNKPYNHDELIHVTSFDENIKILFLEIPQSHSVEIKNLKNILYYSSTKIEEGNSNTLISGKTLQLLSIIYASIVISSFISILHFLPISLVNDNEVLIAIKLTIAIFLAAFSLIILYGIVMRTIFYFLGSEVKVPNIYSKIINFGIIGCVLYFSLLNIAISLNMKFLKRTFVNPFSFSIPNIVADFYLQNKTSLVFDENLKRPILYLGTKDNTYYYYDTFEIEKLKKMLKDENKTEIKDLELLKKYILKMHENSEQDIITDAWKIGNARNINFDNNYSLIVKTIFEQTKTDNIIYYKLE